MEERILTQVIINKVDDFKLMENFQAPYGVF